MNKLEAFAAGACCTRCKTNTGICARRYACGHHLRSLNTIAERLLEKRIHSVGLEEAIESADYVRLLRSTHGHLVAASVDEHEAAEWAKRQMNDLTEKYPQLDDPDRELNYWLNKPDATPGHLTKGES